MKKNFFVILTVICFIFLSLFGCNKKVETVQVNDSVAMSSSKEQLLNKAKIIIVGKVLETKIENLKAAKNSEIKMELTISKIEIQDVLKGQVNKGDIIEVAQLGDGINKIYESVEKTGGFFKRNDKILLFLERDDKANSDFKEMYSGREMPYLVFNSYQGQFKVDENENISNNNDYNLFKDSKTLKELKESIINNSISK